MHSRGVVVVWGPGAAYTPHSDCVGCLHGADGFGEAGRLRGVSTVRIMRCISKTSVLSCLVEGGRLGSYK